MLTQNPRYGQKKRTEIPFNGYMVPEGAKRQIVQNIASYVDNLTGI